MSEILLAVDGSAHSIRVIDAVVKLARDMKQARVHVLNVQEEPVLYGEVAVYISPEKARQYAREAGERVVAQACERLHAAGMTSSSEVVIGAIAPSIVERATAHGAQLIALGTRGMGALGNLVLGSVAMKVVHLASVPVLLVH